MAQQIIIEVPGTKISELERTSSVKDDDVLPLVQDDETKQATLGQVADLVKAGLGSAAFEPKENFATPESVGGVEAASQQRDTAISERVDNVEFGLVSIANGSDKSFATYAEMIAYIPNEANVSVRNNDPDPALRGTYIWNGTEYIAGYDPIDAAMSFAQGEDKKVIEQSNLRIASTENFLNQSGLEVIDDDKDEFGISDQSGFMSFHVNEMGDVGVMGDYSQNTTSPELLWGIGDQNGFAPLGVTLTGELITGDVKIIVVENSAISWAVVDENGFAALAVTPDGVIDSSSLQKQELSYIKEPLAELKLPKTQYSSCIDYGQSLSRGVQSFPVIDVTQPSLNLMLKSGVLRRSTDLLYDKSELVPLIAERIGNEAEPPGISAVNYVSKLMQEHSIDIELTVFINSAPGAAGYRIDQLTIGTAPFNDLIQRITDEKALADAQNIPYSVVVIFWTQGEANQMNGTTFQSYIDQYGGMRSGLISAIKAITGQTFDPLFIQYQNSAQWRQGNGSGSIAVNKALFKLSELYQDVICATPMYHFPYASDNLHLSAIGSVWLGHYYGRCLNLVLNEGKKFKPLHPTAVSWTGKYIDITYYVPVGSLTLDTEMVAEYDNYGFLLRKVSDNSVVEGAIESVSITSRNTIRVVLTSTSYSTNEYLISYAQGRSTDTQISPIIGARGNIRDQNGDIEKAIIQGIEYPMHNFSIIFDYTYGGEL